MFWGDRLNCLVRDFLPVLQKASILVSVAQFESPWRGIIVVISCHVESIPSVREIEFFPNDSQSLRSTSILRESLIWWSPHRFAVLGFGMRGFVLRGKSLQRGKSKHCLLQTGIGLLRGLLGMLDLGVGIRRILHGGSLRLWRQGSNLCKLGGGQLNVDRWRSSVVVRD